jgi:hypothetical protein
MALENTRIYKKHKNCPVKAIPGPFGPHAGKLICTRHNKNIQWLSKADLRHLNGIKERSVRD